MLPNEKNTAYLNELMKSEPMTFQETVYSGILGSNRNVVRKKLTELTRSKLIKEVHETRKRGQKLSVVLTDKGKNYLADKITEDIKTTSQNLEVFINKVAANPEKIYQWRKASTYTPIEALNSESPRLLFPDEIENVLTAKRETTGRLWQIVDDLIHLIMKIEKPLTLMPNLRNLEITFSEQGKMELTILPRHWFEK